MTIRFLDLPDDLVIGIISFLDASYIGIMSRVCRGLRHTLHQDRVWHRYLDAVASTSLDLRRRIRQATSVYTLKIKQRVSGPITVYTTQDPEAIIGTYLGFRLVNGINAARDTSRYTLKLECPVGPLGIRVKGYNILDRYCIMVGNSCQDPIFIQTLRDLVQTHCRVIRILIPGLVVESRFTYVIDPPGGRCMDCLLGILRRYAYIDAKLEVVTMASLH